MPYVHHTVLHFPISFGILAVALALLSVNGNERWERLYRITAYLAALTVVLAAASGLLAAPHAIEGGLDEGTVGWHRNLGLAGGGQLVLAAFFAWQAHRQKSVVLIRVAAAVSVLAAGVVSVGAHVGGDMIHPGLAPWSKEKHMHGQMDRSHDAEEEHSAVGRESLAGTHSGLPSPAPSDSERHDASAAATAADRGDGAIAHAPDAPSPTHDHRAHVHGAKPTGTPPAATANAPPMAPTKVPAPAPSPKAAPPETGMPPGHRM